MIQLRTIQKNIPDDFSIISAGLRVGILRFSAETAVTLRIMGYKNTLQLFQLQIVKRIAHTPATERKHWNLSACTVNAQVDGLSSGLHGTGIACLYHQILAHQFIHQCRNRGGAQTRHAHHIGTRHLPLSVEKIEQALDILFLDELLVGQLFNAAIRFR